MNKVLKFLSQNKKYFIPILGVALFLSLVPLHLAQANIFTDIWNGIITLPMKSAALFVAIPLALLAVVAAIFYTIFIAIFGWLKAVILSIPVIPAKVGVVEAGWDVTQSLANLVIILILVFIGLATILRIKEYEAKKLLPTLIIVALLINFSPVLVGFIVDITNIITNFFLQLVSLEAVGDVWQIVLNYWAKVLTIITTTGPVMKIIGDIFATLFLGIVLLLFFGYATWIYFLVTVLLFARIIVLWILMILAPLAFLFYIMPATKGLAKQWWQQLVQWSILAIPLGFFLFLSFEVLKYAADFQKDNFFAITTLEGKTEAITVESEWGVEAIFGSFTEMFGIMLTPLISIIILHIGYKLSRRYMPAAANGIIGGIEKGMKFVAGTAMVAATGGAAAGLAAKGLGGLTTGAKGLESALGRVPIAGKALKYGIGRPTTWATRGMEMAGKPWLEKQATKLQKIDVAKEMKERGIEEDIQGQVDFANKPGITDKHRLQAYSWMKEKGTLQKTSDEEKDKAAALAEKYAKDPHFKREAGNVADALTDRISAKAKIELEPTTKLQNEMEEEINKAAEALSAEVGMKPVIDEEATKLASKKFNKSGKEVTDQERDQLQEPAAKNVAARYVHFTELKSGDMKDQASDSITSKIAGRSLRDATSGHIQAIVNNFKPKTSAKALDQTFNGMFRDPNTNEDYSDDKAREILENYLRPASDDTEDMRLAERHRRMFRSSFTTPGMREMNIKWKKYLGGRGFDKFLTETEEKGPIKIKGKPAAPPEEEAKQVIEQTQAEDPVIKRLTTEMPALDREIESLASQQEKAVKGSTEFNRLGKEISDKSAKLEEVRTRLEDRKKEIKENIEKMLTEEVKRLTDDAENIPKEIEKLKNKMGEARRVGKTAEVGRLDDVISRREKQLEETVAQLPIRQSRLETVITARETEEEELVKKAEAAISKKPARKMPGAEKGIRKDYQKYKKNVGATEKDTKNVLAEIEKARKEKEEEKVKDLQKKYEDRQRELEKSKADLRNSAIDYGKYLKEVEEVEKEDKGIS